MNPTFPHAMSEGKIGSFVAKNRIYMSAQTTSYGITGVPNERHIAYLVERARGGLGLIFTEAVDVLSAHGYPENGLRLSIASDDTVPAYARLADALHAEGTGAFMQLTQTGHTRFWAPSDVGVSNIEPPPREMPVEELDTLKNAFAAAAVRAKKAGFDGIEVHLGHGHLLHRFLSPILNVRQDNYGGSFGNRLRYPLEVVGAIREAVGSEFPFGVRVSSDDLGGLGPDEHMMVPILERIVGSKLVDFINVSQGGANTSAEQLPDMTFPEAPFIETTLRVIDGLPPITLMATGRFRTVATAERVIAGGKISFIGMTRAHTADPEVLSKSVDGRADEVRPCVACNYCGETAVASAMGLACMVNARAGREFKWQEEPPRLTTGDTGPIVVVGGGAAGMEFARMAARRGATVELHEAGPSLGGQMIAAASAETRKDFLGLISFFEGELKRNGVKVTLNSRLDVAAIQTRNPFLTVLATGSGPVEENLEGFGVLQEFDPTDLATGDVNHCCLIDREGGWRLVAAVEAWMERSRGRLTIVTPAAGLADGASAHFTRTPLVRRLATHDVSVITDHQAVNWTSGVLTVKSVFSGSIVEVDGVDIIRGVSNYHPRIALANELRAAGAPFKIIGDAFIARDVLQAIHSGHLLAMELA